MTENQALDPYEVVLADLRAKRDQIDQAISAVESVRSGKPNSAPAAPKVVPPAGSLSDEGPGAFLGMTIPDAAKALLASRRRTMGNAEIVAAFKAGGLAMNSADPINTVGSVLTRRFNQVGDIVRVSRGLWGLAEWYPNRSFRKKPAKGDPVEASEEDEMTADEAHASAAELASNIRAARPFGINEEPEPWAPLDQPIGRSPMED